MGLLQGEKRPVEIVASTHGYQDNLNRLENVSSEIPFLLYSTPIVIIIWFYGQLRAHGSKIITIIIKKKSPFSIKNQNFMKFFQYT